MNTDRWNRITYLQNKIEKNMLIANLWAFITLFFTGLQYHPGILYMEVVHNIWDFFMESWKAPITSCIAYCDAFKQSSTTCVAMQDTKKTKDTKLKSEMCKKIWFTIFPIYRRYIADQIVTIFVNIHKRTVFVSG